MMNDTWGHTDRQIFERVPSCDLLQTVEGLPVGKSFNTAGFGIVTAEVKEKLQNILIGRHGDLLINTLKREFDRWHVLGILHAFYLGLYHETIRPASISKNIVTDGRMHGRMLERIFAHNVSSLSKRFTALKTPRKIDHGGKDGPGLDIVMGDRETNIIWGVVMTVAKSATGAKNAQTEIDKGILSNLWYTQFHGELVGRFPNIYTPNHIMSIRFYNMEYSPAVWKEIFWIWRNNNYEDDPCNGISGDMGHFLKQFFIDFGPIMDYINSTLENDAVLSRYGIFEAFNLGEMQILCDNKPEGLVIKYSKKGVKSFPSVTLQIPHRNIGATIDNTGDGFMDRLHRDMHHVGWHSTNWSCIDTGN